MKPKLGNADQIFNIIIYAQSGALAGDLAALLSGHHNVNLQTNLSGVLHAIKSTTNVLLMVKDNLYEEHVNPVEVLMAVRGIACKVIFLGQWEKIDWKSYSNNVVVMPEIPSPSVLLEVISQK